MVNYEIQQCTDYPRVSEQLRTTIIPCYLKDGSTAKPVEVTVVERGRTLDLKSINTFGVPQEEFGSLSTDIGEHFEGCGYTEFEGLFTIELK